VAGATLLRVEDDLGQRRDVGAQESSGKGALRTVDPDVFSRLGLMLGRLDILLVSVGQLLKTSDLARDAQKRLQTVPLDVPKETRLESDSSGRPVYVGEAQDGTPESEAKWTVKRITYTASGAVERVQTRLGVTWNGRATLPWP